MSGASGEGAARSIIITRIGCLQTQLKECVLTPLLKREMRNIIKSHSEALKLPSFTEHRDLLESLDSSHERFVEHWEMVHKDYLLYTKLTMMLLGIEIFLTASFEEDYLRVASRADDWEWAKQLAPLITSHREGMAGEDGEKYDQLVHLPLQEMGVDVDYVEDKVCRMADGKWKRHRDGYVTHLIEIRDWQRLAETLVRDRQLASDFFNHEPLGDRPWSADTLERIYERINKLERIHFETLSSPTDFKLSKRALQVSTGKVEIVHSTASPAVVEDAKYLAGIPGMGHIKSILSSVAGSVKVLTRFNTGSQANRPAFGIRHEEKTPLVESKDIS